MTPGPAYRAAARMHFEPMAHRVEQPEPLWRAVAVLLAGLIGLWFLINVVLVAVPA